MKRNLVFTIIVLFPLFLYGQKVLEMPKIRNAEGPSHTVELDAFVVIDAHRIKLDTNSIKLIEVKWVKRIEIIKDAKYKELYGDKDGTVMIYPKRRFKKAIIKKLETRN